MSRFVVVFICMYSNVILASVDHPLMWNSVIVEAEKDASVKLIRNKDSLKIEKFKVSFDGKDILVNKRWFNDITQPLLRTLKVTWGCGPVTVNEEHKIEGVPMCENHISFRFLEDVSFDVYPDWYEDPEVTYYIVDGAITKRYLKYKDSKNHWNIEWLDYTGKKWKTEQVRYTK